MNHRNSQAAIEDPGSPSEAPSVEIHPAVIVWALVIGLIVAFAVTASSFALSFVTLYDLAAMAGARDLAWVIPVVLDGPILAAGIFRIALSQHSDRRTIVGRRFIIAVFALTGLASMAGNAYHAVLTVTDLDASVAGAIGALAPLMVMTMSEMISIVISAPRLRASGPPNTTAPDVEVPPKAESAQTNEATAQLITLFDERGGLDDAVWLTAHMYQNHPDTQGNFAAVSRHLGVTATAVSKRYDKWARLMNAVTAAKAAEAEARNSADRNQDRLKRDAADDPLVSSPSSDTAAPEYAEATR
ncbi:DUF2637 domain-containing protein [Rhodococcus sp. KRD162]|uniref:DUF2637 domain-containing protein n=1 Tax=Rhodococcus sp. KRD162 TaxID=2729725 RepID=UPI0019D2816B|nr:DUF2637 domain-containing protein [Rhodococcus sp. KRD162]